MNVVVPMAGRGSRLSGIEPQKPKPLIDIDGRPMVAWALESLSGIKYRKIIFVILADHESKFGVRHMLRNLVSAELEVVLLDNVTEGQLCTVLTARQHIDMDLPLLVASSDTFVLSNIAEDIEHRHPDCRGIISVANAPGEQWSFARTDATGRVVEVAEKRRISDHASTGLYYFQSGKEFVSIADGLVGSGEKTGGEYYVMPVFQKYVSLGKRVDVSHASVLKDMGSPEALRDFENWIALNRPSQAVDSVV